MVRRHIPIIVTKGPYVPMVDGNDPSCSVCGESAWSQVYAPALQKEIGGRHVWECFICKDRHIERTTKLLEDLKESPFGLSGRKRSILNMAEVFPCPRCLGTNLLPVYEKQSLILQCVVCDNLIQGKAMDSFLRSFSRCEKLVATVDVESHLRKSLIKILCLYSKDIQNLNPLFVRKVFPFLGRYESSMLSDMAATLLGRRVVSA